MRRKLRMIVIFIALFIVASLLSLYSYGHFAKYARGEASYTLPLLEDQTNIDRGIVKELAKHPEQTGLMLLTNNMDAFAVRVVSAREAGRSLDLQYYIWKDDITGKLLDIELLRAADRGVKVRLLLDDMNAHGRNSLLAALNTHPNITIRMFNPTRVRDSGFKRGIEILLRAISINHRMHNKAWIVDGRIAIVGGRNIGDEYFDASPTRNFFDVDLVMAGPAVNEASQIFDDFWNSPSALPLEKLVKAEKNTLNEMHQQIDAFSLTEKALPYIQQLKQTASIQRMFHGERPIYWTKNVHIYSDPAAKAENQQKSQWLTNKLKPYWESTIYDFKIISPYFVPGETGIEKFTQLRQQDINIDILTNSLAANDVLLVHSGYAPYRKQLLTLGINLFELKPLGPVHQSWFGSSNASLHTKAFLIDDKIGFVGSFNFDPRSVMLNTEMGVVFEEPTIVAQLLAEFKQRTSNDYSYHLMIRDNHLTWQDQAADKHIFFWTNEPETKWWQRTVTKVMSWLPIESQL